jgi:hypothetical protein
LGNTTINANGSFAETSQVQWSTGATSCTYTGDWTYSESSKTLRYRYTWETCAQGGARSLSDEYSGEVSSPTGRFGLRNNSGGGCTISR